jgi:hypothetical protein
LAERVQAASEQRDRLTWSLDEYQKAESHEQKQTARAK